MAGQRGFFDTGEWLQWLSAAGELRGTSRLFLRRPVGAEMCGPMFTQDGQALLLAVQHPADDGENWQGGGKIA